jgi:hypothetical protein
LSAIIAVSDPEKNADASPNAAMAMSSVET